MIPDDDRRQRLAYAIRVAMATNGLSPRDVADRIEPKRSEETIKRWRRAQTVPSALDVGPLARALEVRPELLIDPPAIPVPVYPIDEYLLATARSAIEEGVRRAAAPRVRRAPDTPPPSPRRQPRGNGAGRGKPQA